MLGAERLLPDRQRALIERPRAGEVALGLKQQGEVVEARRRIGMLGAEGRLDVLEGLAPPLGHDGISACVGHIFGGGFQPRHVPVDSLGAS